MRLWPDTIAVRGRSLWLRFFIPLSPRSIGRNPRLTAVVNWRLKVWATISVQQNLNLTLSLKVLRNLQAAFSFSAIPAARRNFGLKKNGLNSEANSFAEARRSCSSGALRKKKSEFCAFRQDSAQLPRFPSVCRSDSWWKRFPLLTPWSVWTPVWRICPQQWGGRPSGSFVTTRLNWFRWSERAKRKLSAE